MSFRLSFIYGLLVLSIPLSVSASYVGRQDVQSFIANMVQKHGFGEQQLTELLAEVKTRESVLEAISRPAESKPWREYRPIFITEERVKKGMDFWRQNAALLQRAEKEFGVPPEMIVAIIGVETFYGTRKGHHPVLDSLVTLGFEYPPRSKFFLSELEHYFLLTREEGLDPRSLQGSYAGAMGIPQFISSSYRAYAVDFDGDGKRDLLNNPADAIGSVANYFKRHGWTAGEMVVSRAKLADKAAIPQKVEMRPHTRVADFRRQGVTPREKIADDVLATLIALEGEQGPEYWLGLNNFYVITRYNRSPLYAMAVYQLSQKLVEMYRSER